MGTNFEVMFGKIGVKMFTLECQMREDTSQVQPVLCEIAK